MPHRDFTRSAFEDKIKQYSGFLGDLIKPVPNTGGGAASAYVAGVAVSLILKICLIECNRLQHDQEGLVFWKLLSEKCEKLAMSFFEQVSLDTEAYEAWSRARKGLNNQLDCELAFAGVVGSPIKIMEMCVSGLLISSSALNKCRRHLVADIWVSIEMLKSTLLGAQRIAEANFLHCSSSGDSPELKAKMVSVFNAGTGVYDGLIASHSKPAIVDQTH